MYQQKHIRINFGVLMQGRQESLDLYCTYAISWNVIVILIIKSEKSYLIKQI